MKSIILCEGKTDLILLSYYLCKAAGWYHLHEREHKMKFQDRLLEFKIDDKSTQQYEWYFNGRDDLLCLYAVGTITSIKNGFQQVLEINLFSTSEGFDNVVFLCDRDDEKTEKTIYEDIGLTLALNSLEEPSLTNNSWSRINYRKRGEVLSIKLLPLIIPFDENGTMETFLLNCRAALDECEKELVKNCRDFTNTIESISAIRGRYLSQRGIKPKVVLGTYFSVVSPNRTFDVGHNVLTSVPWEEYTEFNNAFEKLLKL